MTDVSVICTFVHRQRPKKESNKTRREKKEKRRTSISCKMMPFDGRSAPMCGIPFTFSPPPPLGSIRLVCHWPCATRPRGPAHTMQCVQRASLSCFPFFFFSISKVACICIWGGKGEEWVRRNRHKTRQEQMDRCAHGGRAFSCIFWNAFFSSCWSA